MPKRTIRFHTLAELHTAARVACAERWRKNTDQEWGPRDARFFIDSRPGERELRAREIARGLVAALHSAINFCEQPAETDRGTGEHLLLQFVREHFGRAHSTRDDNGLPSVLSTLDSVASPDWPDGADRGHVVERFAASPWHQGEMDTGLLAVVSILIGNAPSVTSKELRAGVSVAEVIAKEANDMRAAFARVKKRRQEEKAAEARRAVVDDAQIAADAILAGPGGRIAASPSPREKKATRHLSLVRAGIHSDEKAKTGK